MLEIFLYFDLNSQNVFIYGINQNILSKLVVTVAIDIL